MVLPSIWENFFVSGGYGMFPTALSGFLLLTVALLLALRPERRYVPLVLVLGLMTLGSGVLATLVGIVRTFHFIANTSPVQPLQIAVMGIAEASHCLILALLATQTTLGLGAIAT
jgi:hypothetical protein